MNDAFRKFAAGSSSVLGSPWAFLLALSVVAVWALLGPALGYSEAWQLAINTGTTIVTFLMVFIIQNTQNRDARALHLKLDELIEAVEHARNEMVDIEHADEQELKEREEEFASFRQQAVSGGGR